jgi:hypothetical protein
MKVVQTREKSLKSMDVAEDRNLPTEFSTGSDPP